MFRKSESVRSLPFVMLLINVTRNKYGLFCAIYCTEKRACCTQKAQLQHFKSLNEWVLSWRTSRDAWQVLLMRTNTPAVNKGIITYVRRLSQPG